MKLPLKSRQSGFTVIELIVIVAVFALAGALAYIQINNLKIANQDDTRKTAINAIYYGLEEVYYKKNGYYPQSLTASTLPSVDPSLFTDPDGFTLGEQAFSTDELQKLIEGGNTTPDVAKRLAALSSGKSPNYHYDPTNCDTQVVTAKATPCRRTVSEAKYIKTSRNH